MYVFLYLLLKISKIILTHFTTIAISHCLYIFQWSCFHSDFQFTTIYHSPSPHHHKKPRENLTNHSEVMSRSKHLQQIQPKRECTSFGWNCQWNQSFSSLFDLQQKTSIKYFLDFFQVSRLFYVVFFVLNTWIILLF